MSETTIDSKKPNFVARRTGGVILTGLTVLGGIQVVKGVEGGINRVSNHISSVKHDNQMYDTYSKPALAEHLDENHISPTQIKIHYVQQGEGSPIEVARNLGAKNISLVASEIAGQVGGSHDMQISEAIALPLEQLNNPSVTDAK